MSKFLMRHSNFRWSFKIQKWKHVQPTFKRHTKLFFVALRFIFSSETFWKHLVLTPQSYPTRVTEHETHHKTQKEFIAERNLKSKVNLHPDTQLALGFNAKKLIFVITH